MKITSIGYDNGLTISILKSGDIRLNIGACIDDSEKFEGEGVDINTKEWLEIINNINAMLNKPEDNYIPPIRRE
jgi:hypothetical protein